MKKGSTVKQDKSAKKRFGQCFLIDNNIISKIVSSVDTSFNNVIIEIGPGRGALTKLLINKCDKLVAYEIDNDCATTLKESIKSDKLEIINMDFLKADLEYLKNLNATCVSNIPYYITSPIISRFIFDMESVCEAVFMVQKEVGDRLTASVGTKDYNSFTIMVQYYMDIEKIINVKRTSFNPSPNVDSMVIKLRRKINRVKANDEKLFNDLVNQSFKERRKTLVNNLIGFNGLNKDDIYNLLDELDIDYNARAEVLSIDKFIKLSNMISK